MLYYDTIGSPNQPAIVYLHGFLGTHADFKDGITFSTDHFHIFIDLPGHGKSPITEQINYETWATECLNVLKELTIKNSVHLIGYSLGGRLALYFSDKYHEYVNKLTLLSTSLGIKDEDMRIERKKSDDEWCNRFKSNYKQACQTWIQQELFTGFENHAFFKDIMSRRYAQNPESMGEIIKELSPGNCEHFWNKITTIKAPITYVYGEKDLKFKSIAKRLAKHTAIHVISRNESSHYLLPLVN